MKIVVIGECCTDIFEYGVCTRLNPEAPTPVFVSSRKVTNYGMAGNVVQNLKSLEFADVHPYYQLSEGEILKHRIIDENSNYILLRIDNDGSPKPIFFNELMLNRIKDADAVIVSDYDKGFLNIKALKTIAWHAKLSFLDTKKPLGDWAENFTWIKINKKEFDSAAHDSTFMEKNKNKIVVTLGGKGAMIGEKFYFGHESEVKDVVGAGDSFLAAFSAAYLVTYGDLEHAVNFANLAGSKVVKKKGVADLEDMKEEFDILMNGSNRS
jgi:bifunctional ADP-heptose synthase (sugar kinase/adenylyltransferase)